MLCCSSDLKCDGWYKLLSEVGFQYFPGRKHSPCQARRSLKKYIRVHRGRGNGKVLPMEQILRNRMAPVHRPPVGGRRIVLVKQMVSAVYIYHAVGIIHPVCRRCKMNYRFIFVFCLHLFRLSPFSYFQTIVKHGINGLQCPSYLLLLSTAD